MKIGIMGGTFDPIHLGHLLLAKTSYKEYDLDEIWFLPNGNPPHKQTAEMPKDKEEKALFHRIEMLRLAIRDISYCRLCLREAQVEEHSYTYQTLDRLNKVYPEHIFYFILGADSLFAIEQWKCFQDIFPSCVILAAARGDKKEKDIREQSVYLHKTYGADIRLLQTPVPDISSTEIRRCAAHGQPLHSMVPGPVEAYIKKYRLYQMEENGS